MCEQSENFSSPIMSEDGIHVKTEQEANELLKNGILIETNDGVVCMPLDEAISSNMNLSKQELRRVATQLILQQSLEPTKEKSNTWRMTCDSDGGFSSECSDSTYTTTTSSSAYPVGRQFLSFSSEVESDASISRPKDIDKSSEESDSTRGSLKTAIGDNCLSPHQLLIKKKGRGGWPKGRKRKPELLHLSPKAPATGYTLYLNEQRNFFKGSTLQPFEITKIIGNRWSSLTLEEKIPYLDRAEEDKKRYREELKAYRQSEAYRTYLDKKRRKRLQNHVLSESDMDATDDFDEEDNEELYCRTCDQWFHNLHNKREHLQAKKHLTSLAGDMHRELSDIESSIPENSTVREFSPKLMHLQFEFIHRLTAFVWNKLELQNSQLDLSHCIANTSLKVLNFGPQVRSEVEDSTLNTTSIQGVMSHLTSLVRKREQEIKLLRERQIKFMQVQRMLSQQLAQLNEKEAKLKKDLAEKRELEKEMEMKVIDLWQVPSMFVMSQFDGPASTTTDLSEEN